MTFLEFGSGERPLEGGSVERSDLCLRVQRQYYPTVCPRSSDPVYIVTNYIKWVTTS